MKLTPDNMTSTVIAITTTITIVSIYPPTSQSCPDPHSAASTASLRLNTRLHSGQVTVIFTIHPHLLVPQQSQGV